MMMIYLTDGETLTLKEVKFKRTDSSDTSERSSEYSSPPAAEGAGVRYQLHRSTCEKGLTGRERADRRGHQGSQTGLEKQG